MITYELALQLKDAGFPGLKFEYPFDGQYDKRYLMPTLSELIEACGDRFMNLYSFLPVDNSPKLKFRSWEAWAIQRPDGTRISGEGKTPEEAVAKLWLELNKK